MRICPPAPQHHISSHPVCNAPPPTTLPPRCPFLIAVGGQDEYNDGVLSAWNLDPEYYMYEGCVCLEVRKMRARQ